MELRRRASALAMKCGCPLAVRRIGLERPRFGSDCTVFDPREHAQALAIALQLNDGKLERILAVRAFARTPPLSVLR